MTIEEIARWMIENHVSAITTDGNFVEVSNTEGEVTQVIL